MSAEAGEASREQMPPERGGALAVPADRRLRVPLQLPHRRPGRSRRRDRLAVRARASTRRACSAPCSTARPARFRFGPVRDQRPDGPVLRARDEHPGHHLEHADRLGGRARRADDRARGAARTRSRRTRARRPTRTPTTCWFAPSLCLEGSVEMELICEPVFDYGRDPAEWTLVDDEQPHRRRQRRRGQTIRLHTDMALGIEGNWVRARHMLRARASRSTARCRGPRASPRRTTSTTPTRGSPPPPASGATGWIGRASPTIASASRSSAPRWRSRASPTCRPARRWPRSRPRCPRPPAASATGTTASPGCATRPSRCRRCTTSTSTGRPTSSCSSSPTSSRNDDGALQIMYGIDGRRDLTESTRDDLSGYAGASPVRVGNGAFDQRQNDVYGAVLDSILLHTRRSQRLPRRLWPIVAGAGRVRHAGLAAARPGHLGGSRQAPALRLLEADVLGRAGPRLEAGRDPRRPRS